MATIERDDVKRFRSDAELDAATEAIASVNVHAEAAPAAAWSTLAARLRAVADHCDRRAVDAAVKHAPGCDGGLRPGCPACEAIAAEWIGAETLHSA